MKIFNLEDIVHFKRDIESIFDDFAKLPGRSRQLKSLRQNVNDLLDEQFEGFLESITAESKALKRLRSSEDQDDVEDDSQPQRRSVGRPPKQRQQQDHDEDVAPGIEHDQHVTHH